MKSKFFTYAVILVVLYYVAGYLAAFQVSRELIRARQWETIEKNSALTQSFSFSSSEWKRIKVNSREFSLNGEMFDVVELTVQNDVILVKAISDEEEKLLIEKFSRMNESPEKDHSRLPQSLLSFLSVTFLKSAIYSIQFPGTVCIELTSRNTLLFSQLHKPGIFIPPDFLKG